MRAMRLLKEPRVGMEKKQTLPAPQRKTVVIIGGGISGCASAYYTAEFYEGEVDIVLVEKEEALCRGATY